MKYTKFYIENYRAITEKLCINLSSRIIPLVGVNECGKTTILQAVFCFDYSNDKENGGQHLQNTDNLYSTVSAGDCIISAEIECNREEIVKCVQQAICTKEKEATALAVELEPDAGIEWMERFIEGKDKITSITIQRNITKDKNYSCDLFDGLSSNDENLVCKKIVQSLPYILYNDDFNDRPVSSISLSGEHQDGWYDIFERVFQSTNDAYSLETILEQDERRRKAILSDVGSFLGSTLTEAWSKFSTEQKQISIELELDTINNALEIYIKEQPKGKTTKTSFFKVTDRSKGFIWYYNFIMKIRFNPKQGGAPKETVFLLDEPGSYLHATAQAELCEKLKDISAKEGVVIYCTHSPQLLLPSTIPLNNILIVEKKKGTEINVMPVSTKNNTSSKRSTAMQPVFEALQLPEYETVTHNEKILCVEGIYDKYCIESFCAISANIRLFPSVSASAIVNNIQYFIAYQKEYMALWDNDAEGKKEHGKARKMFGEQEAGNFALLPDVKDGGKVRMEEMLSASDYTLLRNELALADGAKYETIIATLYFTKKTKKAKIVKLVSDEAKSNFAALASMIDKKLGEKQGGRK